MRKRSKYRPKPVLANPLAYVMESMTPIAQHEDTLLNLKIKNHGALAALVQGRATRHDINTLVAMSNMTEALWELGFGAEYQNLCVDGRYAILAIVTRARTIGRFTPTGPEIQMLNAMAELHDAQMEVVTVRDIERGLAVVHHKVANNHHTIRLPAIPAGIK